MRTHRKRCCLCLFATTVALIAAGHSRGGGVLLPAVDTDATIVDALGDVWYPNTERAPEARAALADDTCISTGGVDSFSAQNYRYRGVVLQMVRDTQLQEFLMELNFSGDTDLYFSVYRVLSTETGFREYQAIVRGVRRSFVGDGSRQLYSSGVFNPPIDLQAGYDYALGVAWESRIVTFWRDVPQFPQDPPYPRPFSAGEVLGVVSRQVDPDAGLPFSDNISLTTTGGFAYSMQFCLKPQRGACCDVLAGACTAVTEDECTGTGASSPGNYFHGEFTQCGDVLCPFGACCTPCGECLDDYTPQACESIGGASHWPGTFCPADPTALCKPVTGACCVDPGSGPKSACEQLCAADCADRDGIYHGDGTSCEPDNLCLGACCVTNGCVDVTPADCSGTFKGAGTACNNLPRELECGGACCTGFGSLDSCSIKPSQSACTPEAAGFPTTAYLGDGSVCPADCTTDVYGACCLPDGTCVNSTADYCDNPFRPWVLGEYAGDGTTCGSETCTLGACCFDDGSCEELTQTGCVGRGGGWTAGGTCSLNTCTGVLGACCLCNGTCTDVNATECSASGGMFEGAGTDCASIAGCEAFGACCRGDGGCAEDITMDDCVNVFGALPENWSQCMSCADVVDSCDRRRACCSPIGICFFIEPEDCRAQSGGWETQDGGSTCDNAALCLTGACCDAASGACEELTEFACLERGFLYFGDDTVCGTSCSLGICIYPDGTCEESVKFVCEELGGVHRADVTCADLGACCLGESCSLVTEEECNATAGRFVGAGKKCEPDLCTFGACCDPDETTCTDFLIASECTGGGEFQIGLTCLDADCERGACCVDGACEFASEGRCTDLAGEYLGADTDCDTASCAFLACILPDGTCTDATQTACDTLGGTANPDLTCADFGACCRGGTCALETAGQCIEPDGLFAGAGTQCETDTCTPGACCELDETCTEAVLAHQCAGDFQVGAACVDVACDRGACLLADDTCTDATQFGCDALGGTLRLDVTCAEIGACCDGEACSLATADECAAVGEYLGNGTDCGDAPCTQGACVLDDGTCTDTTKFACNTQGVLFRDDAACADLGACCIDGACALMTVDECAPVDYAGAGTDCTGAPCTTGVCCHADETCADGIRRFECLEPDEFSAGEDCVTVATCQRGACCTPGACEFVTAARCTDLGGDYLGDDTDCTVDPCTPIQMVGAVPSDGSIDARQPSNPNGSEPAGWSSVVLEFDNDPSALLPADFDITQKVAGGAEEPGPTVTSVTPMSPTTVELIFSDRITPGAWTKITHTASGTSTCLGFLPGDVNRDGTTAASDIGSLIDCINGATACDDAQCNLDRVAPCAASDIGRLVDLLNGAGSYNSWLLATLPSDFGCAAP